MQRRLCSSSVSQRRRTRNKHSRRGTGWNAHLQYDHMHATIFVIMPYYHNIFSLPTARVAVASDDLEQHEGGSRAFSPHHQRPQLRLPRAHAPARPRAPTPTHLWVSVSECVRAYVRACVRARMCTEEGAAERGARQAEREGRRRDGVNGKGESGTVGERKGASEGESKCAFR